MSFRHNTQVMGFALLGLIFTTSLHAQGFEDYNSPELVVENSQDDFSVIAPDYERSKEYGVAGGTAFTTLEKGHLDKLCIVYNDKLITAIQCIWKEDGAEHMGKLIGAKGTAQSIITFNPKEYINRVEGRINNGISQITLFTSEGRKFGPFGDKANNGSSFEITARVPVVGFFGHAGNSVNGIGLIGLKAAKY